MNRPDKNRRQGARVMANFECSCASTRQKGSGVLVDISYSGALLEDTSVMPTPGETIGLSIDLRPAGSFLLIGNVTRYTHNGFAIEFDAPDEKTRRLVDDTAAILASQGGPRISRSDS